MREPLNVRRAGFAGLAAVALGYFAPPAVAAATEAVAADEDVVSPAPGDPDGERLLRLQQAVSSIVHGPVLGRTRVGIRIVDARDGRSFYSLRAGALMDPASNQKILATAAALLRLGNDYRFRTELHGPLPDAEGVIDGDLVLQGSSDPSLHLDDLHALADAVVARGVKRVTGAVIADRRRVGGEEVAEGAKSPLHVRGAAVVVRVRPADKAGRRPFVSLSPGGDMMVVSNRASTRARGRSRIRVSIGLSGGRIVVSVTGSIARKHPGLVLRRQPSFSMLYAATLFRESLIQRGVEITGPALVGSETTLEASRLALAGRADPTLLALHRSAPLPMLMRPINKISNNDYADRLLETLGAEVYGGPASMAKGVRALREAMDELGLPPSGYLPSNGSGLGHQNRVTARTMVELLRKLYLDPRIGPEIMQSLSVGGVDGTTRQRFRASPAANLVRAKTGTLNGKSILSGYVGDGPEVLIFSILVERIRGRAVVSVRNAQVRIVEAMMSYIHGASGEAPADIAEPGRDFETGEDEDEVETDETEAPVPGDDAPADEGNVSEQADT